MELITLLTVGMGVANTIANFTKAKSQSKYYNQAKDLLKDRYSYNLNLLSSRAETKISRDQVSFSGKGKALTGNAIRKLNTETRFMAYQAMERLSMDAKMELSRLKAGKSLSDSAMTSSIISGAFDTFATGYRSYNTWKGLE